MDVKDFQEEYSWEGLESVGAILKFARLVSLYEHIKTHDENRGRNSQRSVQRFIRSNSKRYWAGNYPKYSTPILFSSIAEYYLIEANVQKFSVGWVNLANLIDSLNRNPSQIYGDFLLLRHLKAAVIISLRTLCSIYLLID